jgi:hypothetical protein
MNRMPSPPQIEKRAHDETAAFLRARTAQMREEALRWAGKHEQDTQKVDRETEVLKEIKQQDLATMLELEERCVLRLRLSSLGK